MIDRMNTASTVEQVSKGVVRANERTGEGMTRFLIVLNQSNITQPPSLFPAELLVGDHAGAIHIWDLKTDHNEQRVPDPEAMIHSIAVDAEGKTMAAINNKVS